eukprot:GSA25T00025716001.1
MPRTNAVPQWKLLQHGTFDADGEHVPPPEKGTTNLKVGFKQRTRQRSALSAEATGTEGGSASLESAESSEAENDSVVLDRAFESLLDDVDAAGRDHHSGDTRRKNNRNKVDTSKKAVKFSSTSPEQRRP